MERRAEVHAELERLNRKILEQLGREPSGSDRDRSDVGHSQASSGCRAGVPGT